MQLEGSQMIAAPREAVWAALNDPAVLKACLPGCESVEQTASDQYAVVLAAAVGPVKARFKGALQLEDADAPRSCTLLFQGQGGVAGFGKGSARVELDEVPEGTLLRYVSAVQVGGKLAQVGARLIESVARKMSNEFFAAFREQLVPANKS